MVDRTSIEEMPPKTKHSVIVSEAEADDEPTGTAEEQQDPHEEELAPIKDPVQLEWKNIRFDVKVKGGKFPWSRKHDFTVLDTMSGYVRPGEVLAIMGPSGAGKTSLLNILSQRELDYTGRVRVNGQKLPRSFPNFSAYVEQDDVIHAHLTVLQALRYSAFLRLPTKMSIKEKLARVDEVIEILGLEKARNTIVGQPGGKKGISGGERKRLCIGIEILKRPSILFLDEPTSGLDASTALNVVKAIRNLAKRGTTVIMTIHQPRSQIFSFFDKLLLLADGKVAYHGDANSVDDYFTEINPTYAVPEGFNVADHMIDLISRTTAGDGDTKSELQLDNKRIAAILNYWEKNYQANDLDFPKVEDGPDFSKFPNYSTIWPIQYGVLLFRNAHNFVNNRMLFFGKVIQAFFIIIFLSSLYFQMDNTQTDVQNRLGLLYFLMLSQVMNSLFSTLSQFPVEFTIFKREKQSRAYSTSAYYLAKVTSELPFQIFFPVMFGAIVYYIVGFNPLFVRYVTFLVALTTTALAGIAVGEVISVSVPKVELGLIFGPLIILFLVLFSGFFIIRESIPPWYIWIYYISLFSYGFRAMAINEFDGLEFRCTSEQIVGGVCPVTNGRQALINFDMDFPWWRVWVDIGVLIGIIVILKILGFLILWFRTNTIRSSIKRYLRNRKFDRKEEKRQAEKRASQESANIALEDQANKPENEDSTPNETPEKQRVDPTGESSETNNKEANES